MQHLAVLLTNDSPNAIRHDHWSGRLINITYCRTHKKHKVITSCTSLVPLQTIIFTDLHFTMLDYWHSPHSAQLTPRSYRTATMSRMERVVAASVTHRHSHCQADVRLFSARTITNLHCAHCASPCPLPAARERPSASPYPAPPSSLFMCAAPPFCSGHTIHSMPARCQQRQVRTSIGNDAKIHFLPWLSPFWLEFIPNNSTNRATNSP